MVSSPQAVSALKLSLVASTLAVLTTAVFGTIIAWVLVRDSFRGKGVVNAIIDLPFALPTIVAGLVLMALYGPRTPIDLTIGGFHFDANVTFTRAAIYVALLFVTLPFVVRTVQPVLMELDEELEDAARSLGAGRVHDLPARHPARHPPRDPVRRRNGVRERARRNRGDHHITGNLPFKTEVASVYLFLRIDQDPEGSAAVATVAPPALVRRPARHRRAPLARHEARPWVGSRSASSRSAT